MLANPDADMASQLANVTSAQPKHSQTTWHIGPSNLQDTVPNFLLGLPTWQYVVTFLLGVIVYDQREYQRPDGANRARLTIFLVAYIIRKGSIAGPPFKIPFMGPFIQALHPKFEGYLAQWASGPLSCVSVFHK